MYSLIAVDSEEVKKAKGVNKNVVKKVKHKEYIDALFNKKMIRHKTKRIQSKLQKLEIMMFVRSHCLVLMIKDIF